MSQMSFEDDLNSRFDELVEDLFTDEEIKVFDSWLNGIYIDDIPERINHYTYGSEGIVKHDNDDLTDDSECDKV